jgi:cell division protein FtsI (penicillin-binding protein 3)
MKSRAHSALNVRLPVWRARFLVLLVTAGFMTLAARALYLQGLNKDFLQARGESRYARTIDAVANRGTITDRNGDPLAISTPVESVWASPQDAKLSAAQRAKLARVLEMPVRSLARRLGDGEREFVYLKRQLPPEVAAKVVALNLPGVFLQREYRRYYPAGEVAAHVIGFTSVDDRGQEGIELAYQHWLAGKPGSRRVIKDRLGRIVEDVERMSAPRDGRALALSIDRNVQYLAYRELRNAAVEHQAKAASIVVLDVQSGEVLALANWPSYNPNNRETFHTKRTRNRAVVDLFEPGSTLKPFTAAAAMDAGLLGPGTLIDVESGRLRVGNRTIRDVHNDNDLLTVSQVIQKSSNVGSAKIALSMEPQDLWQVLTTAGFGATPRSGFPGEASGRLRDFDRWKPIEQATVSYGHGISVSLLQLARAYTVFATDGVLSPLTFVRRDASVPGERVISARTAQLVRTMLESVTEPGGTAMQARVTGYRVAGKTGTVHKLVDGTYAPDRYISSFVGLAPTSKPRLVVAVMIDEPGGKKYYGGEVAAPVFREVTAGALRVLGVPPDNIEDIRRPLDVELPREEV